MTTTMKTHKVPVKTLKLSRDLQHSTLSEFFEGTGFTLFAWNQPHGDDGEYRGLVEHDTYPSIAMVLKEGLYAVRVRDQVFKPVSAEELDSQWGIVV